MNEQPSLKISYPIGTRLLLGVAWQGTAGFALLLLRSNFSWVMLSGSLAATAAIGWMFWRSLLPACEIGEQSLSIRPWIRRRSFSRSDLLGCEEIGSNPKASPSVVIRFKTGVAVLSEDGGCRNPGEVLEQLARLWSLQLADVQREPAGPVAPELELSYEKFHRFLLGAGAILLALVAVLYPPLWVCMALALFCARACYYCCGRVATSTQGISFHRPWQKSIDMSWEDIRSIRYSDSAIQGGMTISSAAGNLRIYRWLSGYPKFNRLLRDRLQETCFPAGLQLPLKISMNRSRRTLLLPAAVLAGAGLAFALSGSWAAAAVVTLLPLPAILMLIAGSGREIEIDAQTLRDTHRVWWHRRVAVYQRSELQDLRLGRQLMAGGLWIRFGQTRIEITNADSAIPPEEILACLLKEWECETDLEREKVWSVEGAEYHAMAAATPQ
jgi:hypothetical protein